MTRKPKLRGQRCQCPACGELFNSAAGFDRHRVGPYQPMLRRCLTVAEMTERGMSRTERGFWVTARMAAGRFGRPETAEIPTDPLPGEGVAAAPLGSATAHAPDAIAGGAA